MRHVIPVLWGALLTLVTAWSLGMLLFRKLSLAFHKWEERLLAFIAGGACLSAVMFVLAVVRVVRRGVLLVLALAIIGYAARSGVWRSLGKPLPPLSKAWRWIFGLGFAAFTYVGFFNALAPEHSSDGMAYHLGEVLKYSRAHGFFLLTTDLYSNLSQGIELLYLFAFSFGRHSSASLVHFTYLVVLALLILSYGQRIGRPGVGAAAALFTYASPLLLKDATTAYVDVALAANVFALFYLLQVWDENRDPKMLVPIGLLAGFGYEIKYTAIVAIPYAVGFVAWKLWREGKPVLRPALVVSLIAASCLAPWMIKNWIEVVNPVSPLFNRMFPNPFVHVSFEDGWRRYLRNYDLPSKALIPMQVTVHGDRLEGFVGPLFLLTPFALLALRFRAGRQLLLAAAIFASTYFTNIGARFLIPVIPFVSLALALVFDGVEWLLPTVAAVHLLISFPDMPRLYASPVAYRIQDVPIRAALRLQAEDAYLSRDPDYVAVRMMVGIVPPNAVIFTVGENGQSYLPRDLRVGYESAANEVLEDILWTPVFPPYMPSRVFRFDFAPRHLRKLRVVQLASLPGNQWSVAELRIFDGQSELSRDPGWRLTARPNPWDVQLAFDNSPVTRWRTWQPAAPGMYIEIDFGKLASASSVVVQSTQDMGDVKLKLEGLDSSGAWVTLADHPVESLQPIHVSLRRAATAELKARGIQYLSVRPDTPGSDDLRRYPAYWGLTLVGTSGQTRLYHID
jgi:hypothetical protein